jgi:hypothetical protein
LVVLYSRPELFRATIDMARHRFGSGQYRYFTHDLPEPVRRLRQAFYPHLLVIAREPLSVRFKDLFIPNGPWRVPRGYPPAEVG